MLNQCNSCDKENILHQCLKVQAQVKVIPLVTHGRPVIHCIDSCIEPRDCCRCHEPDEYYDDCSWDDDCETSCESESDCNFVLTQTICIEIPISFDADVEIEEGVLCCGKPEISPDLRPVIKKGDHYNSQIYILMKRQF